MSILHSTNLAFLIGMLIGSLMYHLWYRTHQRNALVARLEEAADIIDEAYSHGDTAAWAERAGNFLKSQASH